MLKPRKQLPFSRLAKAIVLDAREPRYKLSSRADTKLAARPTDYSGSQSAVVRMVIHGTTAAQANSFAQAATADFCVSGTYSDIHERFYETVKTPIKNYLSATVLENTGSIYQVSMDTEYATSPQAIRDTVGYAAKHGAYLEFAFTSRSPYLLGVASDEAILRRVKVEKLYEDGFLGRGSDGLKRYRYSAVSRALALRGPAAAGLSVVVSFLIWRSVYGKKEFHFGISRVEKLGEKLTYRGVGKKLITTFDQPRTPKELAEVLESEEQDRIKAEEDRRAYKKMLAEENARYYALANMSYLKPRSAKSQPKPYSSYSAHAGYSLSGISNAETKAGNKYFRSNDRDYFGYEFND